MSKSALSISAARNVLAACLPVAFFAAGVSTAWSQCSQASRPEASFTFPSTAPEQSGAPALDHSSSSSDTPIGVRFSSVSAITVLEDTPLQVISDGPISSRTTKAGAKLPFTVTRDVVVDGILVIPCGARIYGTVVSAKQAGRLTGASNLTLELTELNLDGKSYPLYTPPFKVVGQSKTRPTAEVIGGGAAAGAVAMEARNESGRSNPPTGQRLISDGISAGMGAGVGTIAAASSAPSIAFIPAEAQFEFSLTSPIAVFPVDERTAVRLARGMHRGGPTLYVRGESQ